MQSESYNILEIKDKKIWDEFIISQPTHTFLHSWAWGEFNEAAGDKVWRLGISNPAGLDPDRLVAAALIVKVHARRGNFLFIPHGPIGDKRILPVFIDEIKRLAKQEKVGFIRISPLLQDVEENEKSFRDLGFRPAPIHMHAETTWTLSLQPSEEEILADMRKTTRNLIRRAQKENVTIKTGTSDENIEIFYDLYRETVKKHNFTPFSLASIKNQVKILSHNSEANIFTAWHNGEALASAIIIFYIAVRRSEEEACLSCLILMTLSSFVSNATDSRYFYEVIVRRSSSFA